MISVLLPVYNYPCAPLLQELADQLHQTTTPFEIIVMEDGSVDFCSENRLACEAVGARYIPLKKNIGRSAIRNRLASEARYEWFLFMDCDSRLTSRHFIGNYLNAVRKVSKPSVICGGRTFGEAQNAASDCYLHWYYGSNREPAPDENNEGKAFLSNNFVIHRELFGQIRFEERLREYGHEDTLFGIELSRKNQPVRYINNPVFHEGLDDNDSFLSKSRKAVANLKTLEEQFLTGDEYKQIRLLQIQHVCRKLRIEALLAWLYECAHQQIENRLKGKKPNLYLFDIYKLGFLCKVMRSDRTLRHRTDHE